MRSLLTVLILLCFALSTYAQPTARRKEQQQQNASKTQTLTTRALISYPTAAPMAEDVVWRRDIYREINLEEEANSGLYYPVEPTSTEMNLFTYIFKLMMRGDLKVYEYRLDGNEVFNDSARVKPLTLLDNYHIYYERNNGRVRIDNSDIPSREVKSYYIKESAYYDQASATFHTKVIALCPIMSREDDFGDSEQKYPLFWVKYEDLAPFLSKQIIMTSDLNNAATMSADDYFTLNRYRGKIYKTNNMLGRTLSQYCPTDSAMSNEQKRIEKEIEMFENNIFRDQARADSLDSIAKTANMKKKGTKTVAKNRRASSTTSTSRKTSSGSSSSGSGEARISVRRERH
ncbi:MAG: gliding motility protein GldN [Prevotella sp.]|nr:gliding motility protein GldN [Prevotella sp.]